MKTKMRNLISVFLAAVFLTGLLPVGYGATVVDSGSCGENALWTLDDAGLLTIEGTGAVENHAFAGNREIRTVRIGDGITGLGIGAFELCENLEEVRIPAGVTELPKNLFAHCSKLTRVDLPEGLLSIGESAFMECPALTALTLPESLETIKGGAFNVCTGLRSVTIPKNVSAIDGNVFRSCDKLTEIVVDEENAWFTSVDGVLFDKEMTTLLSYPTGKEDASYRVPATVHTIETAAFIQNTFLTSVQVPNSVTEIRNFAFSGCANLEEIDLQANITQLSNLVLADTAIKKLVIPNGVETMVLSALRGCGRLTDVVIPRSVTTIENYVFAECNSLQYVFYEGSEADWQQIEIGDQEPTHGPGQIVPPTLSGAIIHYRAAGHTMQTTVESPSAATCTASGSHRTLTRCIGAENCPYNYSDNTQTLDPLGHSSKYIEGAVFSYGSYPQSEVTDAQTLAALNAQLTDGLWQSFGYYSVDSDTEMPTQSDFMKYADLEWNGEKYRAVTFSKPRTGTELRVALTDPVAYYDYSAGEVYWFRYEPLKWKVLDAAKGFVACENLIDSQPYGGRFYGNREWCSTTMLRDWLNGTFFDTAFTEAEKNAVLPANVPESDLWINYHGIFDVPVAHNFAVESDRIFLLSMEELIDPGYFPDGAGRIVPATDYARVNGYNSGFGIGDPNVCRYYIRTTSERGLMVVSDMDYLLYYEGKTGPINPPLESRTNIGVRPAMYLSELPEDPASVVRGYAPTCTEDGLSDGVKCVRCGEWITEPETLPAPGHDYRETARVNPTCTDPGEVTYVCSRDSSHTYTEPLDPTGHAYAFAGWTWTETPDGYTAAAHFVCANDPAHKQDVTAAVTAATTDPDCVNAGQTVYTAKATFEGATYTDEKKIPIAAKGHDLIPHEGKAPTCEKKGWAAYETCARCDYTTYRELPATGHAYESTVVAKPTCTEKGRIAYVCKNDPAHAYEEEVAPLGHSFGKWFTVKAATTEEPGLERRECARCDAFEEREIPKLTEKPDQISLFTLILNFFRRILSLFRGIC